MKQIEGQITLTEWVQWKEDIRKKLQETAENFVYIGYRLKQIRDTRAYEMEGAEDIFQFAQQEYGLTRSVTSRFMAINDRFSIDGDSMELREEFRGFGSSKLQEMLTLSEEDCALIDKRATVQQIRELKEFEREAEEETESEELNDTEPEKRLLTPLERCIEDYFRVKPPERLNEAMRMMREEVRTPELERELCEVINPRLYEMHRKGMVFLVLNDYEKGVNYKVVGVAENQSLSWAQFLEVVAGIYKDYIQKEDVWKSYYENPEDTVTTTCATSHTEQEEEQPETEETVVEATEEEEETEKEERENCATSHKEKEESWGDWGGEDSGRQQEKKEILPPPVDAVYSIRISRRKREELLSGLQFLILKKQNQYRPGNTLVLEEYVNAEPTGEKINVEITHMEDESGGITPGWCVLQLQIKEPEEDKEIPGQMEIRDYPEAMPEERKEDAEQTDQGSGIQPESTQED